MHDIAIIGITAKNVGNDFAKGVRKDTLIDIFDGVVYILF
jgi:hypothetical protein